MKLILIYLLLLSCSCFAEQKQECPAELDGYIQQYEVYRKQLFAAELSKCVPDNESFVMLKGISGSSIDVAGFVVGIEVLYHQKLGNLIKITSKTGAHTTVVKLLAHQYEQSQFTESFNWDFYSSMEFITLSKTGPENLQIITRNNQYHQNCSWAVEDKYHFSSGVFKKVSTSEIDRNCHYNIE